MSGRTRGVCRALCLLIGLGALAAPGQGQAVPRLEDSRPAPAAGLGVTYIDLGSGEQATPSIELTLVDRTPRLWRVGLSAGLIASVRGTVYGYGGLHLPISLPLGLVARPSVGAGLYAAGEGFDLGHTLEFRSALVLERQVTHRLRVSAVFYHLSNGGLGRSNPGMEAVGVGLSVVPPSGP